MSEKFIRTKILIGSESCLKLKNSTVAVFGIGGVGTYVVEGLVRAGVGRFILIDDDVICESNINRQIHATTKTIGKSKVLTMKARIQEINPEAIVVTHQSFVLNNNIDEFFKGEIDYVVDALDTVTAKIAIAMKADELQIPIMSSMGTGNKLNPAELTVSDLYSTSVCPLCKVMRKELKKRGLMKLKVVYSTEYPLKPIVEELNAPPEPNTETADQPLHPKRAVPGSMSFVPSVAGMIIASEVVKDLIK